MNSILRLICALGFLGSILLLTGCGTPWNAGVAAATSLSAAQVATNASAIRAINDVLARTWMDSGCELPFGLVARTPSLFGVLTTLCGAPTGVTVISTQAAPTAITSVPTIIVPAAK